MLQAARIIYVFILVLVLSTVACAGDVWRITSLDWQPYSDSTAANHGYSIQKLRTLLQQEGIELVVEFYPWARAQEIAKQDGYVGYFPAWPEEVGEGFIASSPVDWSEIGVMTYKGSGLEWTTLEAVFQEEVGLVTDYVYPKPIEKLARSQRRNVDPTPNELALLRKLSAKRITAAITDPTVMLYLANKVRIDNVRMLKWLDRVALVLAVRDAPENEEKLRVLERLLAE